MLDDFHVEHDIEALVRGGEIFRGDGAVVDVEAALGGMQPAPFILTRNDAKSTFSIDVDTAAYANTRRHLLEFGSLPPVDAVRTEELINYFDYAYPQPSEGKPFSVVTEA